MSIKTKGNMEKQILDYLHYIGYENAPINKEDFEYYLETEILIFQSKRDYQIFFAIKKTNIGYYCYVIYCRNIEDLYNKFKETASLKCKTIDEVKNLLNMTI